jgi:hypothetical protein
MPLFAHARDLMRANLEKIHAGTRVVAVQIGTLTLRQLEDINNIRAEDGLPAIIAEVYFVGGHMYRSRATGDGYTIEDILDQISSAMDSTSVVIPSKKMTSMQNPNARADKYGNHVRDRAIFECSRKHPRPELYSVMPKGDDGNRPCDLKKKGATP